MFINPSIQVLRSVHCTLYTHQWTDSVEVSEEVVEVSEEVVEGVEDKLAVE